ncbi:hypothetical protein Rsub_06145 [Raphidocelis subcapitata]|uniref:J domain-containing protein n=1 Tax=Raphidocelis subcapitata TaxID=307507 RepID=A0A2V0P7G0_9CHLO|nr:hypothetical protein Rsub_06145 [Raphidocelis subcapitata]|eukprot:GBF93813.1 hypothetical protein Rsub_06145 [Raphidocelis subcapitata]
MRCPYATLGLSRGTSSQEEIKAAYRALVVETHPDKHATAPEAQQAAAAARFKDIQEAYQLLSDDRKRTAYEASRSAGRAYSYAGVNTDWSTRGGGGGYGEGYTSRLGRWQFLRRAARDGMRSFDQPLHFGFLGLLLGGVILFDAAHDRIWAARNKGKRFEDVQAAVQQRRAGPEASSSGDSGGGGGSGGGGRGSEGAPSSGSGGGVGDGEAAALRSVWLDSMRGREVRGAAPAAPAADVDRGGVLRASPAGQMTGHR